MHSSGTVPNGRGNSKMRPSVAARRRPRMCRVRSNFIRRATFAYTTAGRVGAGPSVQPSS